MSQLVAGVDLSTRALKVLVHDMQTGAVKRSGIARFRCDSEINPNIWLKAFHHAAELAGGLNDVAALAVAGQQHGLIALDEQGEVVRNAILWNDIRSAKDASDLIGDLGDGDPLIGKKLFAEQTGSVPVASLTITKLRWLARVEPEKMARTAAVALPHDWLTWKIRGCTEIADLVTDRSEASGTGYFNPTANEYVPDLLQLAIGNNVELQLPKVIEPNGKLIGQSGPYHGVLFGPGLADNASASFGLEQKPGKVTLSIGNSGVVSTVTSSSLCDETGVITSFADATGNFLPLVGTLNASRVLEYFANMLGVDERQFANLALGAPPGAEGLVVLPYLAGERTPNIPDATGSLLGIRTDNFTPANIARAAIEGVLCSAGTGIDMLRKHGVAVNSIALIGGGGRSEAIRRIAPSVLGVPIEVPEPGEYVAEGAARQAAWVLAGNQAPPPWRTRLYSHYEGQHLPFIMDRYQELRHCFARKNMQ